MNRDIAFEQKVRDMLHRGESNSYERAEFKTRVREGYERLGEISKNKTESDPEEQARKEAVRRRVAEEFRQKALSSRRVDVQNYFDVPRSN